MGVQRQEQRGVQWAKGRREERGGRRSVVGCGGMGRGGVQRRLATACVLAGMTLVAGTPGWAMGLAVGLVPGMGMPSKMGTRVRPRVVVRPWDAAVRSRAVFEAAPKGRHTRAEYAQVMDGFRAIYHDQPADAHAARAVEQVAELLVEQGTELGDRKSLRDGAAQYEFLARAYPAYASAEKRRLAEAKLGATVPGKRSAVAATRERAVAVTPPPPLREVRDAAGDGSAMATVSGIRHWSTASYTRVVIDLPSESNEEVTYQASRVEHPDRIFVDLHHTRLAPGLVGKTFAVTDDGFLSKIRAAASGPEVTRVVLDVQAVAEYSAFLLPNPERLIIDIHGRTGTPPTVAAAAATVPAAATPASVGGGAESSLPPMPVTDGSATFGLESRSGARPTALAGRVVAAPRVVIPSKVTPARPVPNTSVTESADAGTDVAAVSRQAGKIDATGRPTSQPVVSGGAAGGDHYHKPVRGARGGTPVAPGGSRHVAGEPAMAAPPTGDGETSLVRALGLKIGRIVIDAGHGGHDSGTLGAGGIEEKDVVLDVALRLGKLLHDRLGAEIVYTRADDTFIPLETRTAIANKAQADLFISVHANSSPDESARGVEVYYLNFTSDPDAMKVASRENAVSTQSVHELSDLVKRIALKDKIEESKELAADVDASLYAGLRRGNDGLRDRGVKKAPFVVLIGANMPSILAEISFVTNPEDAEQLETPAYRERVAESLFAGVKRYEDGVNAGRGPATERAAK